MLNLILLIILVMVLYGSCNPIVENINDDIMKLPSEVKSSENYTSTKCNRFEPSDFLTLTISNESMFHSINSIDSLMLNATFDITNHANPVKIELEFKFLYMDRGANSVSIYQDGSLYLKEGLGNVDTILPFPKHIIATNESSLKYYGNDKYFILKWENLELNTTEPNVTRTYYTIAVAIYNSGEIIALYNTTMVPQHIISYYRQGEHNTYEYVRPVIKPIVDKYAIVYINKCVVPAKYTSTSPEFVVSTTTDISSLEESFLEDPNVKNSNDIVPGSYNKNPNRIDQLYGSFENVTAIEIPTNGTIINFDFYYGNENFENVNIQNGGKIVLNSNITESPQIQIEPIPNVTFAYAKFLKENGNLSILLEESGASKSQNNNNTIILALNQFGTIELFYKTLDKSGLANDGDNHILVHTSNLSETKGKINFAEVENGVIVTYDNKPTECSSIKWMDEILHKFHSKNYIKNTQLVADYYACADTSDPAESKELTTINSLFNITYGPQLVDKVYVAQSMDLYFEQTQQKLQIVPIMDDKNLANSQFKYTRTPDYIMLTWTNLTTTLAQSLSVSYNLRMLIFKTNILILFKDVRNNGLDGTVSHEFLPGLVVGELSSGTIVNVNISEIYTLQINNLLNDLQKIPKRLNTSCEPIYVGLNEEKIQKYLLFSHDRIPFDTKDNTMKISSPFKMCEQGKFDTVYVTDTMDVYFEENAKIRLLPDDYVTSMTHFSYSTTKDYISISWNISQYNVTDQMIRLTAFPSGDILILYNNLKSDISPNKFIGPTPIELKNGTIVLIKLCDIVPKIILPRTESNISFTDVLLKSNRTGKFCKNPVQSPTVTPTEFNIYLNYKPDEDRLSPIMNTMHIDSKFPIQFEPQIKFTKVYIENLTQIYFKTNNKLNLLTPSVSKTITTCNFKYTAATNYISMTWSNSQTIRIIILPNGTILIFYDIDENVKFPLLNGVDTIAVSRGTIIQINACAIAPKSIKNVRHEFKNTDESLKQLNEIDFDEYLESLPDTTLGTPCVHNIFKIEPQFDIKYGKFTTRKLFVVNTTQLLFDNFRTGNEYSVQVVPTDKHNNDFYHTIGPDYITISWKNLSIDSAQFDIRAVIYPGGDIIVLYKIIRLTGMPIEHIFSTGSKSKSLENRTVVKINLVDLNKSVVESPKQELLNNVTIKSKLSDLLSYVKLQVPANIEEICDRRQFGSSQNTIKNFFNTHIDSTHVKFKHSHYIIKANPFEFKRHVNIKQTISKIHFSSRMVLSFEDPNKILNIEPLENFAQNQKHLTVAYTSDVAYISITWTNILFKNSAGREISLNVRFLLTWFGDIVIGYQYNTNAKDVILKAILFGTEFEIKNGTFFVANICAFTQFIELSTAESYEEIWLDSTPETNYDLSPVDGKLTSSGITIDVYWNILILSSILISVILS